MVQIWPGNTPPLGEGARLFCSMVTRMWTTQPGTHNSHLTVSHLFHLHLHLHLHLSASPSPSHTSTFTAPLKCPKLASDLNSCLHGFLTSSMLKLADVDVDLPPCIGLYCSLRAPFHYRAVSKWDAVPSGWILPATAAEG